LDDFGCPNGFQGTATAWILTLNSSSQLVYALLTDLAAALREQAGMEERGSNTTLGENHVDAR